MITLNQINTLTLYWYNSWKTYIITALRHVMWILIWNTYKISYSGLRCRKRLIILERVWKSANDRGYYRTSIRRFQGLQTTSVRKCRWADRGAWQWNCQRLKPIYARRRASARKGLTNEKGFWENQNSFSFRMILVYYENDSFGFAIIKIDKSMIVKGKKILYNVTNCYK